MPRRLWNSFEAGQRPRWDFGRIDSPLFNVGFAEISNFIIENGTLRKRMGLERCNQYHDGSPFANAYGFAFVNGWSDKAFIREGFYYYNAGGSKSAGGTVQYRALTISPIALGGCWAYENMMAYIETGGVNLKTLEYDGDATPTIHTQFGYITESGGRRFFVQQSGNDTVVKASRTNDLTNFTRRDPTGLLYDDDPIDVTLEGRGAVMWIADGFGLFLGTNKGIYELISGLGPGFSPYEGGFFPQSLDNYETRDIAANGVLGYWRHVALTKETVVTVSDVDEISFLHRQARQINQVRLDIPSTHAIDSMAWLGGSVVAVLVAHIANRSAWNVSTGYDASQNFIYLVDENSGAVTKIPSLNPFSIAGSKGRGLFMLCKDTAVHANPYVCFLPWKAQTKYASAAAAESQVSFFDYKGYAATNYPFTSRVTTMPIHLGADLGDQKKALKVTVRVDQTRHFKIGILGKTLAEWTYATAAPALYTGDVTLNIESPMTDVLQLTIEDDSVYPCNILAIQLDLDKNEGGRGKP